MTVVAGKAQQIRIVAQYAIPVREGVSAAVFTVRGMVVDFEAVKFMAHPYLQLAAVKLI